MKRCSLAMLSFIVAAILSSCGRNIPLEDLTISLILGIDLDDENHLIISESSPVFNKDTKKKDETYQVKANSIRESRKYFDVMATGEVTAAKIQVLLIGKRVLTHENWFGLLDTIYRNPVFSINTRVIAVDGPVSDVIFYEPKEIPQLALYLKDLIDKNNIRTRTVLDTLQVLHRQMYEKGMTPAISEIKKDHIVKLSGVALLDEKGRYVDTLHAPEPSLLLVLRNEQKKEFTLSLPMTSIENNGGIFNKNMLSMDISQLKTKVKSEYAHGKFRFKYNINLTVDIVERLFPAHRVTEKELEKRVEKELTSRFEALIRKFQENNIDPLGLGLHARAFHYKEYKKVEDHWGETLAKSIIDVSVHVDIEAMGATR